MLLLKFLQTMFKALNSDGTPGQVGMGMAIGLCFGLTPLMSLHNLVVLAIAMLTTVSFPGVFLGWAIATPLGFALDPLFDRIGMALLTNEALTPFFTWVVNTPVVALSRLNNSIVVGSLVSWLLLLVPSFFVFRVLVDRYRAHVLAYVQRLKVVQMLQGSKLWNLYQTLWPSS
jgi:uncharacterized protein (TIGR03546 family)